MLKAISIIILLLSFSVQAQYEDTGRRGIYFDKKNYVESPIPAFSEFKNKLPSPILEDNEEWLQLYWKSWELAFSHLKKPPKGSPFVSNYIDEAFSPSIFQWDTIFMLMFARYAHFIFPAIQSLDNFYCRQYENGYICREIQEADGQDYVFIDREHTINPPLFSWAEVETYKITGDKSRFKSVIPVLEKYVGWLEKYRKKQNTKHNLYWQTGLGSGMDNTPRKGSAWVDMSCQMVMQYKFLAEMCKETGQNEKAVIFMKQADDISEKINKLMWNNDDGLYYDLDDEANQVKCKTVACFWPLLAGIPDKAQAERMVLHLKDGKSFWRTIPFPSLAADHSDYKPDGQYWLGGVWAPTNVMVIKGLEKFNNTEFKEFAVLAVEKYLDGIYKVFKRTGTIWENYSPDIYNRGFPSKPDFVGWSGCGPVQLLIENVLGFHPEGVNNRLIWSLSRIDKHGIENLRFGDVTVTLVCSQRININSEAKIKINSNREFELIVVNNSIEQKFKVSKGYTEIIVPEIP